MLGRCLVDWPSRYKAIETLIWTASTAINWLLRFSKGYLVLQSLVFPEVVKNKFPFRNVKEPTIEWLVNMVANPPPKPTSYNKSIFRGLPNWTYPSLTAIGMNFHLPGHGSNANCWQANSHGNTLWDHCTAWNSERKPLCATRVLRSCRSDRDQW